MRVRAAGAALIFQPDVDEIYPLGELSTFVEVPSVARRLEGASRPTHFRGVATVVLKLLNIAGADTPILARKIISSSWWSGGWRPTSIIRRES